MLAQRMLTQRMLTQGQSLRLQCQLRVLPLWWLHLDFSEPLSLYLKGRSVRPSRPCSR